MNDHLDQTLLSISKAFAGKIFSPARNYVEVDIGKKAFGLGFDDLGKQYQNVMAVVPIKEPQKGMKVRIDGRTFINYGQLDSGVAIPGYVVKNSNLAFRAYVPNDSMILNFA